MIYFGVVEHARAVARRAGHSYDPDVNYCISRVGKSEELLGGVIYTNFTGRSVQMHQAGFTTAWATPRFMFTIYDFPFYIMKVEKVFATVPSTNIRALNITRKMGFSPVTSIPGAVPGGDMEILSMSRHECKYLSLRWRYEVLENVA